MDPFDTFIHQDKVRDYEADLSGILSHANYSNYMFHTRHLHLNALGFDFKALLEEGHMLVLSRIEIDFLLPLYPGQAYQVSSRLLIPKPRRIAFAHQIHCLCDDTMVSEGIAYAASINTYKNKAEIPSFFFKKLNIDSKQVVI